MNNYRVKLSKRMQAICNMVTEGKRVCDVGCDHAFIDIELLLSGRCTKALAMDINEGPLSKAKEHIVEAGLTDDISIRLSNGLKEYQIGEADSLIISGMGGALSSRILTDDMDKAESFSEMILSPQSEIMEFRIFLSDNNFEIVDEDMIFEDGKFYVIIKAMKHNGSGRDISENRLSEEELFAGPCLLRKKHPVAIQYLKHELEKKNDILCKLKNADLEKNRSRIDEINGEVLLVKRALARMS